MEGHSDKSDARLHSITEDHLPPPTPPSDSWRWRKTRRERTFIISLCSRLVTVIYPLLWELVWKFIQLVFCCFFFLHWYADDSWLYLKLIRKPLVHLQNLLNSNYRCLLMRCILAVIKYTFRSLVTLNSRYSLSVVSTGIHWKKKVSVSDRILSVQSLHVLSWSASFFIIIFDSFSGWPGS